MNQWNKMDPSQCPDMETISRSVDNKLWEDLCGYLHIQYQAKPLISYSRCASMPGWNVKYRKAGRGLCTLYPSQGTFTVLVVIGDRERGEAELILPSCTPYLQRLYHDTAEGMGQKWLMIDVKDEQILTDVKKMIAVRREPGSRKK
ncbi:DUF3788 domain-containing protein [Candidatus Soleaferrea massiliensis]|uniref:DUF3788 domain-containing protein n=1 Tax=Candidatus Soleaferrea massiliensis TaxID=1470354 RepID=UPI00058D3A35|nr:DUF3788 domain-containing protein [Candidatus Soleaferrea massiliensis]